MVEKAVGEKLEKIVGAPAEVLDKTVNFSENLVKNSAIASKRSPSYNSNMPKFIIMLFGHLLVILSSFLFFGEKIVHRYS
jgi:hypothetical protein